MTNLADDLLLTPAMNALYLSREPCGEVGRHSGQLRNPDGTGQLGSIGDNVADDSSLRFLPG